MTYTIKFDLNIDTDDVLSDEEVYDYLRERLESPTIDVKDVQVLEVND